MKFFFVIVEYMLSFDIEILKLKEILKMVNLMPFFEPYGFIKPAPILWFEWFWTVQSGFSVLLLF